MERKVIQLAGKTLVVSLPSKWAKKYGVKKGDTIFVEENDKSITVKTSNSVDISKVSLNLKGPYEFIKRSIDVSYKKGADELSLSFESPSTRKAIEEVLESTMGFEIISEGSGACTVKSVATAVEEEFDNILKRVFLTLLSMADESCAALSGSDFRRLAEISRYDRTINKLTNFCKRVLNKRGYRNEKLTNYVYCIVWEVERIADEYREMCSQIAELKNPKISRDVVQLCRKANEFLREFYSLYCKFSEDKGINLTSRKQALSKECASLMLKSKSGDCLVLHHLANVITSVYDIAGPYYAMVL